MEERTIKDISNLLTQLFQKMKEAGYWWNAKKKKLEKVEQKHSVWSEEDEANLVRALAFIRNTSIKDVDEIKESVLTWITSLKDRVQPKQEWSKEDEEYLNFVIAAMKTLQVKCTENEIKRHSNSQAAPYYGKVINWLKSLRPQLKQEWSEKDNVRLQRIIDFLWYNRKGDTDAIYQQEQDIEWLKSLRHQKQWKPSEEQMKALHDLNLTGDISYAGQGQILIDLYNSLKELT